MQFIIIPYLPHVGHPFPPLFLHFAVFCSFLLCPFLGGFNYFLLLSIPFLSTRIVPLRFQAGGRRKRPNLGLVCCVDDMTYNVFGGMLNLAQLNSSPTFLPLDLEGKWLSGFQLHLLWCSVIRRHCYADSLIVHGASLCLTACFYLCLL